MLARACENESENAKRMRLGLEPVSQSVPSQLVSSPVMESVASQYKAEQLVSLLAQGGGAGGTSHRPYNPPPLSNGRETAETGKKTPLLSHKLNGTEITAVRQLITGRFYQASVLGPE